MPAITDANLDPGQFAIVKTFSKSITLSLLNSPNSFPISTPVDRRFQDACTFLRNNREFIADEVLGELIINLQDFIILYMILVLVVEMISKYLLDLQDKNTHMFLVVQ